MTLTVLNVLSTCFFTQTDKSFGKCGKNKKTRIIFRLNGIMSYPCICHIACHIHGTMWRATLEYAKANRRYAIHRTISEGWALSYCGMRVAGCAVYHKVVLHC